MFGFVRFRRLVLATQLLAMSFVFTRASSAQQPRGSAEDLFDQGLLQMRAGQYDLACRTLARSHHLEALPGVLFTLAECESISGKLATALTRYDEFVRVVTALPLAQQARYRERRQIAVDKIAVSSRLVPQLAIVVPANAPADLVVKRDGAIVAPTSWGVARAVDPGTYELTAEAPNHIPWRRRVTLAKGESVNAIVQLARQESMIHASDASGATYPSERPKSRTLAWVVSGTAAVALAGGIVTGLAAWSKKETIDRECPDRWCSPTGLDAVSSMRTMATASTIAVGVGLAAGIAGTMLFLTSEPPRNPHESSSRCRPYLFGGAGQTIAGVEGRF